MGDDGMVEYVGDEEQEDVMGVCVDVLLDVMRMTGSFLLHVEAGGQFQQKLVANDLEEQDVKLEEE